MRPANDSASKHLTGPQFTPDQLRTRWGCSLKNRCSATLISQRCAVDFPPNLVWQLQTVSGTAALGRLEYSRYRNSLSSSNSSGSTIAPGDSRISWSRLWSLESRSYYG